MHDFLDLLSENTRSNHNPQTLNIYEVELPTAFWSTWKKKASSSKTEKENALGDYKALDSTGKYTLTAQRQVYQGYPRANCLINMIIHYWIVSGSIN